MEKFKYNTPSQSLRTEINQVEAVLSSHSKSEWHLTKLCQLYNAEAMQLLQTAPEEAFKLLQRAEKLSVNSKLKALTLNNWGCYYRYLKKHRTALKFLHESLSIDGSPDTYINICTVLSQLKKHTEAMENAFLGVSLIQHQVFEAAFTGNFEVVYERAPVLATGYHNLAVQLECLGREKEAYEFYKRALDTASKYVEKHHPVRKDLKNFNTQRSKERIVFKQRSRTPTEIPKRNITPENIQHPKLDPLKVWRPPSEKKKLSGFRRNRVYRRIATREDSPGSKTSREHLKKSDEEPEKTSLLRPINISNYKSHNHMETIQEVSTKREPQKKVVFISDVNSYVNNLVNKALPRLNT